MTATISAIIVAVLSFLGIVVKAYLDSKNAAKDDKLDDYEREVERDKIDASPPVSRDDIIKRMRDKGL